MLDVLDALLAPWRAGRPVALATVVSTWASSPRQAGSAMVVTEDGAVTGGVSGGCVEGDVLARAREVLATGDAQRVEYGVADEDAFAVGLACGGRVEVLVQRVTPQGWPALGLLADAVTAGTPVAAVVLVEHPDRARVGALRVVAPASARPGAAAGGAAGEGASDGSLGAPAWDATADADAADLLHGSSGSPDGAGGVGGDGLVAAAVEHGPDGAPHGRGARVLVVASLVRARLLVSGATQAGAALVRLGDLLGMRTTAVDPRARFATAERLPGADEVVVDWPHRYLAAEAAAGRTGPRDALVVVTHDERTDVPLLRVALGLPLGYVGMMGSRRTVAARRAALAAQGVPDVQLQRLRAPVGLDLGGRSPAELALSVAAELVALRWGGSGRPLRELDGPLHHPGGSGAAPGVTG